MGILGFQLLTDNTIGPALDLRMSPLCSLEIFDPTQAHAQIDIWPIKEVLMVPPSSVASVASGALRQTDTRLLRTLFLSEVSGQNQELSNQECFARQRPVDYLPLSPKEKVP